MATQKKTTFSPISSLLHAEQKVNPMEDDGIWCMGRSGLLLLTLELNPLLSLKWAPLEEIPMFLSSS